MSEILSALIRMLAPILSFTTEDIAKYYKGQGSRVKKTSSIFESEFPKANKKYIDTKLEEKWERIQNVRNEVYKKIEELRSNKEIRSSSQAKVVIYAKDKELAALKSIEKELHTIFMVSEVKLEEDAKAPLVIASDYQKCERCWRLLPSVGQDKNHPTLCKRCVEAIT